MNTILRKSIKRKFISSSLILFQLFHSGCIHTSSHEYRNIEIPSRKGLSEQNFGEVKVDSAIYLPSKFPLTDFFSRLKKGEFTDAFKRIDLEYKQSTINDKVLEQIIDSGFIPVYVEIKNQGKKPIHIDEKSFALTNIANGTNGTNGTNGKQEIKAFYSETLPREFTKFNTSAAAANVINTGIVIVGFAAVLAGMLIITSASSAGSLSFPNFHPNGNSSDIKVYNDTTTVTKVNYNSFLITSSVLNPGESKNGLLFFYTQDLVGIHEFKLIFQPTINPNKKNQY